MGAELSKDDMFNGQAFPDRDQRDKLQLPGSMSEEMPEDIRGFFGHPLVAGVSSLDVDGQHASALLHEYHNLPAIDHRKDAHDILRDDTVSENACLPNVDKMSDIFISGIDDFLHSKDTEEEELPPAASEQASSQPQQLQQLQQQQVTTNAVGKPSPQGQVLRSPQQKDPFAFVDETDLRPPSLHLKRDNNANIDTRINAPIEQKEAKPTSQPTPQVIPYMQPGTQNNNNVLTPKSAQPGIVQSPTISQSVSQPQPPLLQHSSTISQSVSHPPAPLLQHSSTISQSVNQPASPLVQQSTMHCTSTSNASLHPAGIPRSIVCYTPEGPIRLPFPFPPSMPIPPGLMPVPPNLQAQLGATAFIQVPIRPSLIAAAAAAQMPASTTASSLPQPLSQVSAPGRALSQPSTQTSEACRTLPSASHILADKLAGNNCDNSLKPSNVAPNIQMQQQRTSSNVMPTTTSMSSFQSVNQQRIQQLVSSSFPSHMLPPMNQILCTSQPSCQPIVPLPQATMSCHTTMSSKPYTCGPPNVSLINTTAALPPIQHIKNIPQNSNSHLYAVPSTQQLQQPPPQPPPQLPPQLQPQPASQPAPLPPSLSQPQPNVHLPLPLLAEPAATAAPTSVQLPSHTSHMSPVTSVSKQTLNFPLPPLRSASTSSAPRPSTRPQPPQHLNLTTHTQLIKTEVPSPSTPNAPVTHKASESTKKIIQALTQKLQIQSNASTDNEALFNEIREIINDSFKKHDASEAHMKSLPPTPVEPQSVAPQSILNRSLSLPADSQETCPLNLTVSQQMSPDDGPLLTNSDPPLPSYPSSIKSEDQCSTSTDLVWGKESPMDWDNKELLPSPHLNKPSYCSMGAEATSSVPDSANRLLVIKPQGLAATPPPYVPNNQYAELKSPDSGFNENCLSPADSMAHVVSSEVLDPCSLFQPPSMTPGEGGRGTYVAKRRRSSCRTGSTTTTTPKSPALTPQKIPKIDDELCLFRFFLDTPTSASQKVTEDRMTYINKGQFYNLVMTHKALQHLQPGTIYKSIVVVVFRDEMPALEQSKAWEFWHSRQHSQKQRILDIDNKNSVGVSSVQELAHNAISLQWRPHEDTAASIAINCLSTDFSNQKGVKGLPLHIQVDTFEEGSRTPVHRSYCQLKIFCDKGAERKIRDEERRREARTKAGEATTHGGSRKRVDEVYHKSYPRSDMYNMADLSHPPAFFSPKPEVDESLPSSTDNLYTAGVDSSTDSLVPRKRFRSESFSKQRDKVLLYVREEHETVFTALLLSSPSLQGFCKAVEQKFSISSDDILHVYKKSRKGILVRMDDNIIKHYSNEATFIIHMRRMSVEEDGRQALEITLTELEEQKS